MSQKLPLYQELPQGQNVNLATKKPSRFSRPLGITIAFLSLLLIGLSYISLVSNPKGWSMSSTTDPSDTTDPQTLDPTTAEDFSASSPGDLSISPGSLSSPEAEESASLNCEIGHLYGSCLNDIRFFQCTPDGPLTHPCPAGQRFYCTGEGTGECAPRRSDVGEGFEMICHGKQELGACRKAD
ncbi:hypothetical protein CERZMDRAFT_102664 [Cercospora zeae-maydis SCOH1-5]|uniref:Uncharacterized protein n=1 Tax=Cercospora zeae-maydis SCOH1-5 TaxID=717836 RepID=A0A6A6F1X7_9PEZI|nr:hypothetical protein CERZMDRAFT_102664 [Cercospora zeae-maydis SCOH1-5]